jgi:hypothetical protein
MRRVRAWASLAGIAAAVSFGGAILFAPGVGVLVHELAGLVLLVLLGTALVAGVRLRGGDPRPVPRLAGAFIVLLIMGGLGALLAVGDLPASLSILPLGALVVLVILLADAVRVASLPSPSQARVRGPG